MTKIFFDTEFTGLHQNTTLISIGLVAENGESFYGEFTDYDNNQVNDWIKSNVIDKLHLNDIDHGINAASTAGRTWYYRGDKVEMQAMLRSWLERFKEVEIWSDCLAYDWVLFCQLFGGAFEIPKNIFYIPFDIATLFRVKGIDPDVNRDEFCRSSGDNKHNALYDAQIIYRCYEKLSII